MAPRETENNAYAKFWGDQQRALWYVMAFLEWSILRNELKSWMDGHAQEPALYWPFIVPRSFGRIMHLGPVFILET